MITRSKINQAVSLLRAGGLVAFPTETVYGLGADASNGEALQKIFAVKERPSDHPLIVHIARLELLHEWAQSISPAAFQLANAFWPGPLTLILQKKSHVSTIVTGGQDTIGLRIPKHPLAQMLLQSFNGGIAGPSANKFTRISPTTALAVEEELGSAVDLILDGGDCTVGLESTIVDVSTDEPQILRPGFISIQDIESVLGRKVIVSTRSKIRVPGMHALHYAPKTKTYLFKTNAIKAVLAKFSRDDFPVALLMHSGRSISSSNKIYCVRMPKEADDYGKVLYQTLRSLDKQEFKTILIEAVPDTIAWDAIRDRLSKASSVNFSTKVSEKYDY